MDIRDKGALSRTVMGFAGAKTKQGVSCSAPVKSVELLHNTKNANLPIQLLNPLESTQRSAGAVKPNDRKKNTTLLFGYSSCFLD